MTCAAARAVAPRTPRLQCRAGFGIGGEAAQPMLALHALSDAGVAPGERTPLPRVGWWVRIPSPAPKITGTIDSGCRGGLRREVLVLGRSESFAFLPWLGLPCARQALNDVERFFAQRRFCLRRSYGAFANAERRRRSRFERNDPRRPRLCQECSRRGKLRPVPRSAGSAGEPMDAPHSKPNPVEIPPLGLEALLGVPDGARGLVIFAHGSGSGRLSPRNNDVAAALRERGLATLLLDLLRPEEESDRANVFDIELLCARLAAAADWARPEPRRRAA